MSVDHDTDNGNESPAERRERLRVAAAARAQAIGITPALIKDLVHGFYAQVQQDDLLGPVFASKIDDWGPHLEKMCAFWQSVMMSSGSYRGQPMPKHVVLPIDAAHFDRWLILFSDTATRLCPPEAAAAFIERAGRIAQSLEMGLAGHHGVILHRDQRFVRDKGAEDSVDDLASSPCGAETADPAYMWAPKPTKQ